MKKYNSDPCGLRTVYTCKGLKGDPGDPGAPGAPAIGGLFKEAIINITASQVKDLHNNRVELLPYSSQFAYNVDSVVIFYEKNGTIEYLFVGTSPDGAIRVYLEVPSLGEESLFYGPINTGAVGFYTGGREIIATKLDPDYTNPAFAVYDGSITLGTNGGEFQNGDSDIRAIVIYREVAK